MSEGEWQTVKIGQALDVVYLPSDPWVNQRTVSFSDMPFRLCIPLAAWLVAPLLVILGVCDIRRRVKLIEEGSPALGVIDHVEVGRGRKGKAYITFLVYTFQTGEEPNRLVHHGELRRVSLYAPGEVKPGDRVLILYDPDDPTRNEIDRFDARQADRLRLMG